MNFQVIDYSAAEFLLGREIPSLQRVTQARYLRLHLGKTQSIAACAQQCRTCRDMLQLSAQQPETTVTAHGAAFCPFLVRSVWELQLSLQLEFLEEGSNLTFFQSLMMITKNPRPRCSYGESVKGRNLLVCVKARSSVALKASIFQKRKGQKSLEHWFFESCET